MRREGEPIETELSEFNEAVNLLNHQLDQLPIAERAIRLEDILQSLREKKFRGWKI